MEVVHFSHEVQEEQEDDLASGWHFFLDRAGKPTDILKSADFAGIKTNTEGFFDGDKQTNVAQAIPGFHLLRGSGGGENQLIIIKNILKDGRQPIDNLLFVHDIKSINA